ncbi:MAG: excinuclease ABC subunit C, partial [Alphaproteobacteria bacterium]|nr:excinuclease ABC subunit C [Alphaproteobacteria bacterium]
MTPTRPNSGSDSVPDPAADSAPTGAGERSSDDRAMDPEADQSNVSETRASPLRPIGTEIIRSYLKTLPSRPGVYRMLDEASDVIYVGKARNL